MRKLFLAALVPCVFVLVGCPKKKDDGLDAGDAAAEASVEVAADAAPVAPTAKNAADIARFPAGEKPVADDDAKVLDAFTQARSGPKSGSNIALVKAGTDPFKIAEFQDCFLVTFPDPKDATVTLMGWIPKTSFTATAQPIKDAGKDGTVDAAVDAGAVKPPGPLVCPAGQEGVLNLGPTAVCRKKCSADKDCKTPTAGACVNAKHQLGKTVRVCAGEAP